MGEKNPNKKRDNSKLSFEQYADIFFKGDFYFGRWDEHFLGWYKNSERIKNGFLLVKYDDLKNDTFDSFSKIIRFLNLELDSEKINEAISKASFENMKKLEKSQNDKLKTMQSPTGNVDFVGSGKKEWQEYLVGGLKSKFKTEFSKTMSLLGYGNEW
ncbi:MAG: sulfotransferase domain-containing protein [Ignavibacteriales bacterium]|nr:sulfotransferase domain-containing protein [Ignavibacteriales bacterium]